MDSAITTLPELASLDVGFDLSHYQQDVSEQDWNAATQAGYKFCFVKCGEGPTFIDQRFRNNWARSRGKLRRGVYFFFRPDLRRPLDQANNIANVLSTIGSGDTGELEIALDVEDPVVNGQLVERPSYSATIEQDFSVFFERLVSLFTLPKLVLYSRASYMDEMFTSAASKYLTAMQWWVANYPFVAPSPTARPRLPRLCNAAKYWQFDNARQKWSVAVPGVGPVDRSRVM